MNVSQELGQLPPGRESVLTVGVFDGVHRGHQHLISHLTAEARRRGCLAGVVTFRNHPASVLEPDFKPHYLTSVEERLGLIKGLGVDFTVPICFDLEMSQLPASRFAALLQERLHMRGLVVGPDFAMGYRREGDAKLLASLGREMGFTVSVARPLVDGKGRVIRSTTAREALARGEVAHVAALMGRSFALTGRVVKGMGRGGPLGFPTANLQLPEGMAIPGDGVYATWASIDSRRYMAATSIGVHPTFREGDHTIEAFILDFEGDLYQSHIRLEFVRRVRDEVDFDYVQALQHQVDRDVVEIRAILQGASLINTATSN